MKTNKLWIKLVKGLAIFLLIVIILSFGYIILVLAQRIQQAQASAPGSVIFGSLLPQILAQLNLVWQKIMFCLAFLGGIQVLVWFARNRQSFRGLVKKDS
ncbi:MAG TPA: hypothetical protein VHY08_00990 [Bacillota bacterium]|nr:hypothetical protein [Bacillota bacterium]